jgi:photosystem II stability/assembly factor-like uncharacterized protein
MRFRFLAFLRLLVLFSIVVAALPLRAQLSGGVPESAYQELHWRMIGPFRGGRTRAAAGVPSQPNVFYVAQVNGGVWKSDDYGRTWNPIFDRESSQSIGAIAVAPSDPNIVYVASGEGLHRPDLSVGDGIYKSTDAGKTWKHVGSENAGSEVATVNTTGLRDAQQIPALAVDPRDPNRVFAAVLGHPYGPSDERGIFRSTDGGETWKKIIYKDENTGGSDVEIDPSNPDVIYASMWEVREGPWEDGNEFNGTNGGLFKSTDGGDTWHPLTTGLPKDLSQIYVAIAPSNPRRLYATAGSASSKLGVYRSDDAGENWSQITDDPRPSGRIGGGDLSVPRVDPKNPDIVYCASTVTMRSVDGGKTWSGFRGAPGGDDYQNLWINPNDPNLILLVSDQGAIVTVNGGATWSSWYNQPTAQLYHVAVTNTFPYRVCAGQQESGSVCISSRGNDGEITFREWHPVGVIEYGYVAPDPLDPDIVYGGGRSEVSRFHWSTGQVQNVTPIPLRGKFRADRTEPLMFSPVDPHLLYYAANVLFKTTDGGNSWQTISKDLTRENPGVPPSVGTLVRKGAEKQRGVIYSLAPSFKSVNTLWAGTDDGLIWLTHDGGKNWSDITPPALTPWSKVTQISASHFDEETAYTSVSRFRINDTHPYIYRTRDGGKSWKQIVDGLPAFGPVDTVREDPQRRGLLFAGTENAVWMSFDSGDHWQSLQLNLPHTSMRDLWINGDDLIVATHGRSFWILDDITPLRQAADALAKPEPYLFRPAVAYRVQRDTNPDTPLPPDEPAAANPPDGAILDYYLPQSAASVTLEILNAQGQIVRHFSSADKPEVSEEALKKQLIPLYWIRPFKALPQTPGMHRWAWGLHATAPLSTTHEYPIAAIPFDTPRLPRGPSVLPGQYTVRLTVDGKALTAKLTVKMDPRVKISAAALEAKFRAETRLASMLSESSEAVIQAGAIRGQLQKAVEQPHAGVSDAIAPFQKKLIAIFGGSASPFAPADDQVTLNRVNQQASTLYGQVWQVDAQPTSAQLAAITATESAKADIMKRWNEFKSADLPDLNRRLGSLNMPEINLQSNLDQEDSQVDEE